MPDSEPAVDPRSRLKAALDQAQRCVQIVRPDDLPRSTPCVEFVVRTLLAHLVAVLRKLAAIGRGGDMADVADPADDDPADWAAAFRACRADLESVRASDALLDNTYRVPWGKMTGRVLLDSYAHEFTVHPWDLAQAVGGGDHLDPLLAKAALDWYSRYLPPETRGQGRRFGPMVSVPDGADIYTQLAGYVGRGAQ